MAEQPVRHLTDDALIAFGAGKLADTLAEAVVAHLESCPKCCDKAASLTGGTLLERLRSARKSSSTPVPNLPGAPAKPQTWVDAAAPDGAILPELHNHPQFEVIRELGRGGMGVVYLAKNKLMERQEVLKVLNRQLLDHPGAQDRFLREIRAAAQLSHENIVKAHSALRCGELLVFAMEFAEGQDLAKIVEKHGQLPLANACYYVQQAAWGLQHAFEKGLVHRDIKPQNLMVVQSGKKKHTVKILDFGLAKARREDRESEFNLTGSGNMLGTPDYIAPEQMQDAANADVRADIYSLGCTLYFLLTGTPPFKAKSLFELMQAHLGREAVLLNTVRKDVPRAVADIAAKMMAKSPKDRYQEPRDVALALAPFSRPPSKRSAASTRLLHRKAISLFFRSWPLLLAGAIAFALIGVYRVSISEPRSVWPFFLSAGVLLAGASPGLVPFIRRHLKELVPLISLRMILTAGIASVVVVAALSLIYYLAVVRPRNEARKAPILDNINKKIQGSVNP